MVDGTTVLRHARRAFATGAGIAAPALVASSVIGTKLLTDAPRPSHPKLTLRVRFHDAESARAAFDVDQEVVEVRGADAAAPGRWGLRTDGAYVLLDEPVHVGVDEHGPYALRPWHARGPAPELTSTDDRRATAEDRRSGSGGGNSFQRRRRERRQAQSGGPWPHRGVLSAYAWPDDPQVLAAAHDATWEVEAVPCDAGGHLPAWRFTPPDPDGTWMLAIHGRGARRAEVFRMVGMALRQGVTCLVVSYRTDAWSRTPAAYSTLGSSEWRDVEAAMRLALSRGAKHLVLAGCSMGGGIAATTLRRSELATAVSGVVLDAPALDWGPTLRHVARSYRLPSVLVPLTMAAAKWRAKLDFNALNHLAGAGEFVHPILLVHGTADDVTPVWLSDALAEARPDLVTYLRVEGAGHVKSWNHAPERYEQAMTTFLERVGTLPEAAPAPRRQRSLHLHLPQVRPA